jgi:hypothetical protein
MNAVPGFGTFWQKNCQTYCQRKSGGVGGKVIQDKSCMLGYAVDAVVEKEVIAKSLLLFGAVREVYANKLAESRASWKTKRH